MLTVFRGYLSLSLSPFHQYTSFYIDEEEKREWIEWHSLKNPFRYFNVLFRSTSLSISFIEHTYIKNWRGLFSVGNSFNTILTFAVLMSEK